MRTQFQAFSGRDWRDWQIAGLLFLLALAVQLLAMIVVARVRGSAMLYAFQSPDAAEYVSLGRGLAIHGRYVPADSAGRVLGGPDTWRTPGFPALLGVFIRLFGDSTPALIVLQQILAALGVPLLWIILGRFTSSLRWALGLSILWCFDPFRIYYSLWILAEPFFTLALLAGVWIYAWAGRISKVPKEDDPDAARRWGPVRCLVLGMTAGALVLIRPIGILLPGLAVAGVGISSLRRPGRRGFAAVMLCAAGSAAAITPWVLRNWHVAGHPALSHQSGASLAYHKVADVLLWSDGLNAYRFDPAAQDRVRRTIDERLRTEWATRFGPLTPQTYEALSWRKLNYGGPIGIDPFVASDLLTKVGLDLLWEHRAAALQCYTVQGLSMLVFPLGLLIAPPAGPGASPLSLLGGGETGAKAAAALIGGAYVLLLLLASWRVWTVIWERRWAPQLFVIAPLLALFVLSIPSEDPRFRLPLVPLLLLLAVPLKQRPG